MALPTNDHHVHSDGYYSERGDADEGRMLMELADEIEQIQGVQSVRAYDAHIEIEYTPDYDGGDRFDHIAQTAAEFGCDVTTISDDEGLLEVRPE